jgi:hypothetical protein
LGGEGIASEHHVKEKKHQETFDLPYPFEASMSNNPRFNYLLGRSDWRWFGEGSQPGSFERQKAHEVFAGTDKMYALVKKYKIKTARGHRHPVLQSVGKASGRTAGEDGPVVYAEGVLAHLLVVEGNPLENIQLITDPSRNFVVIMKDGKIYKNTIPQVSSRK